MQQAKVLLKKYWGHSSFRSLQEEIIEAVLAHNDVLALLPTGGGKSICFQIPAMLRQGTCIVISPLIALMKDQVVNLTNRGIHAAAIFSGMSSQAIDTVLDNCVYGHIQFLYVSPERLQSTLFKSRVKKMCVSLIAVDEAHCISQWGYDFRPAYLSIASLRTLLPKTNIIALTATATSVVKKDIQEKLLFKQKKVFQKSFIRKNLAYIVKKKENKEFFLLKLLHKIPGTTLVYTNTRKKTKNIVTYLLKNNIAADYYHAGLTHDIRATKQNNWLHNTTRVMVATNAFGMGIDKSDVELVIHMDIPPTLEAYYQEAGRAGRNGKKAYAVLLYNDYDLDALKERIEKANPTIDLIKKVYQCLVHYYKIALGNHPTEVYNFDLKLFLSTYQLNYSNTYAAIKKLAEEGIIQLNESFTHTSTIFFMVTRKVLYQFLTTNKQYNLLIQTLLRSYGGILFSESCSIIEKDIAKIMQVTHKNVIKQLQALQKKEIINYIEQTDQPQLSFLTPRYKIAHLPLDEKKLQKRRQINQEKVNAIIYYTQHMHRCREQLLLEYFGEISYIPCKNCDVCIAKNKHYVEDHTRLKKKYGVAIQNLIKNGNTTITEVINTIDQFEKKNILTVIRIMLEYGELSYDKQGKLMLIKQDSL